MSTQEKNKRDEQNAKVGNTQNNATTTNNPERKDQDRKPTLTEPQKLEVREKHNQEKTDKKTALSDLNKKQ